MSHLPTVRRTRGAQRSGGKIFHRYSLDDLEKYYAPFHVLGCSIFITAQVVTPFQDMNPDRPVTRKNSSSRRKEDLLFGLLEPFPILALLVRPYTKQRKA